MAERIKVEDIPVGVDETPLVDGGAGSPGKLQLARARGATGARRGPGEGSIRQRDNGRWEGRIRIGTRRISVYGATRIEAQQKLRHEAQRKADGHQAGDRQITVAAYLARWLAQQKPDLRPSTWSGYESIIRMHLVPEIGALKLHALSAPDVADMMARLAAPRPKRGAPRSTGMSPQSRKNVHATLRVALQHGVDMGVIQGNVARHVRAPRVEPTPPPALRLETAIAIVEAVRGHRLAALYITALATGARQAELIGLRWQDIDLAAATLSITHSLKRIRREWVDGKPKTRHGTRIVPLAPEVVDVLLEHRAQQDEERLRAATAWQGERWGDLVFSTVLGEAVPPTRATQEFQALLRVAGLPQMRFHDLRHGAATLALQRRVSPLVVQNLLGYAHVSITLGTYSHVTSELQREGAAEIARFLSPVSAS